MLKTEFKTITSQQQHSQHKLLYVKEAAMIVLFAVLFLLNDVSSQGLQNCSSHTSCSECISHSSCVWCSTVGSAKCMPWIDGNCTCDKEDIIHYESEIIDISSLPLSNENQITLESAHVELAVGQPIDIKISIKASEDFPLDLYMLMDLSNSFRDDLITVQNIAPELPLSLRNVSSHFNIGFGTFVDKPIPPFVSNVQLQQLLMYNGIPSSCSKSICGRPFGYEHVVSLTNSSQLFNSSVQGSKIATNVDNPEGTLDAMLQAAICTDTVGWRTKSRKILLTMTDDVIHTAGDGALAGIVRPHDGLCHTEHDPEQNKTLYKYSLVQDYPSLEMVRAALISNGIVPVFAIPTQKDEILDFYNNTVSVHLGGFATGLAAGSDNLIDVINEAYSKIVSNARLQFTTLPSFLSVNVSADCPNYKKESIECVNIGNETINFTITLTLTQCTQNLKDGHTNNITVDVPGFGQFTIKVSGHCICNCERDIFTNSTDCSNNGNNTCGICSCSEGWGGSDCSCSTAKCPLGPNNIECSARGICNCGTCICNEPPSVVLGVSDPHINGDACECSNFDCDTDNDGIVCSGRGVCTCSNSTYMCQCNTSLVTGARYTGDACKCSTDHCINPANQTSLVCSGRGTCKPCQPQGFACQCDQGHTGSYCEIVIISRLAECDYSDNITKCVSCYSEAAKNNETVISACGNLYCNNFILLKQKQQNIIDTSSTIRCSYINGDCRYTFYVGVTLNGSDLYAVEANECLLIPSWGIALIILFVLMIIGISILITIKCCIMFLDYQEVKKFEAEVRSSMFSKNINPMYQSPDVKYENVAYGKR